VGINQAVFTGVMGSINVIENRISNLSLSAPSYKVTDARGNKVKALDKSATASTGGYGSDSSNTSAIGRSVWGQVFGTNAKQANSGGFNGYDAQSRGLSFGIDQEIEKDLLVGAALTINNTDVTSTNNMKRVNVDSYQLTLYGEKKYDEYFVDGFVSGALNRFQSDRHINLVGKTASVSYDGYSYSAKARVGMINRLENGFDIIPHAGLIYAYNSATDYQESGAGTLNLSVNNSSAEMLIGDVGVALSYDAELFKYKLRPELKVSYGHDFMGSEQVSAANFVGQGALLNVSNSKSDRNMIRLGVGTDIYSLDQFTLNVSYLLEKRETFQAHTGSLKAKYSF
jgi:outer membrane autotransporter protein